MTELERLKRKLKNAKRRAVYWSGRPSFLGFGFRPGKGRRHEDDTIEYEMAMSDIDSLANRIEKLTGKRPVTRDPKRDYQDAATDVICQLARSQREGKVTT